MGTTPSPYGSAHSANDRKFVGVGTGWDSRRGWRRSKTGLEGAAALAAAAHLPPADEEGEGRGSGLRRGEPSLGEHVTRKAWGTLT